MFIDNFSDFAPEPSQQLVSIGMLCQHLQVMPRQLKILLDEVQSVRAVKFAQVVDGVGYFSVTDAELLADLMGKVKAEVQSSVQAAPNN
jgi:hypothetical protein